MATIDGVILGLFLVDLTSVNSVIMTIFGVLIRKRVIGKKLKRRDENHRHVVGIQQYVLGLRYELVII